VVLTLVLVVLLCLCALVAALAVFDRGRLRRELIAVRRLVRLDPKLVVRTSEAFGEELEIEVLRAERSGRPSTLIVFSLGPAENDPGEIRREAFVHVLRATVRMIDVAYRTGPDEFALILPDTRARGALVAAARVERSAEANGVRVTAGVAETGPGLDRHALFRNAYCALLSAGTEGRPGALAYSPELDHGSVSGRLAGLADIEPTEGSPRPQR
jgi:GGDEF domain-containing protein